MKIKTLKVVGPTFVLDRPGEDMYKIIQVTDTTEFGDKRYLTKAEVQECCDSKQWKVTIEAVSR